MLSGDKSGLSKILNTLQQRVESGSDAFGLENIKELIEKLQQRETENIQKLVTEYQNWFLDSPTDSNALFLIASQQRLIDSNIVL